MNFILDKKGTKLNVKNMDSDNGGITNSSRTETKLNVKQLMEAVSCNWIRILQTNSTNPSRKQENSYRREDLNTVYGHKKMILLSRS